MVWSPVHLLAELRFAANNRYTVASPDESRGNQTLAYASGFQVLARRGSEQLEARSVSEGTPQVAADCFPNWHFGFPSFSVRAAGPGSLALV
jgi:hypothetical protein